MTTSSTGLSAIGSTASPSAWRGAARAASVEWSWSWSSLPHMSRGAAQPADQGEVRMLMPAFNLAPRWLSSASERWLGTVPSKPGTLRQHRLEGMAACGNCQDA